RGGPLDLLGEGLHQGALQASDSESRCALARRSSAAKRAADAQKAYQGALQASGTQVETLAEQVERTSASMEQVGGALMGAGGLLVAGFGMTVKTAADFDKAMSSVRAATHETEENMALLGEAAKKAGADTAYSAEEAAQGIEEMAKAGVSTEEILAGGLDGALSLAAAGALDVGDAAELAASALVQFKLDGSQIPHVADLLAAGAGKAQGSVEDLGAALNQSGRSARRRGRTG
ncbi:phage tail tape measure protein, partial [Micrococcus sp. F3Y]|uniref:phage tail tape measure protein n=1 Tax=Micrococcus sp. F3Y TaxID=3402627 RepID=UPI003AF64B22